MRHKVLLLTSLTVLSLILIAAGCKPQLPGGISLTDARAANAMPTGDDDRLVEGLRAAGADVYLSESVSHPFFDVEGQILQIGLQRVQVYRFADDAEAAAQAARFSNDGAWISEGSQVSLVNWIATPHLYQYGRLILVYVGDDRALLTLLDGVIGAPFAGGANPYHAAMLVQP